jgi:hypothetical protein
MSIQTVDLRVNERRPDIRLLPLVSGGTALILAVAAGIGLWASTRGDVARVAGVEPASPAAAEAITRRAVAAGTIAETPPATTAPTDETIYLVSTPAQADALQAQFDAAAAHAAEVSAPPANNRVVVLGTADADLAILAVNELGMPGVRLVDATSHAVRRPDPYPVASSDQEMHQRWLQAQAAAGPEPAGHPDRE